MAAKLDAQWAMEPPTRFEMWRLLMAMRLVQASNRAAMLQAINGNTDAFGKQVEINEEHERSLAALMDKLINETGEHE